jgi:hypothetical protein
MLSDACRRWIRFSVQRLPKQSVRVAEERSVHPLAGLNNLGALHQKIGRHLTLLGTRPRWMGQVERRIAGLN